MTSLATAALVAGLSVGAVSATHGGTHVTLEPDTKGCNGVLPSNDGNTDMRFAGGSMQPGSTALFEVTYPVNAASVGKQFTILDCAFINGVAALRYTVSFVPSNESYVLVLGLAIPANAPVGGQYCNYVKTTGSPTASQGSQRKAGPACFTIQAPPAPAAPAAPAAPPGTSSGGATPPAPAGGASTGSTPAPGAPLFLPNTATRSSRMGG
ncbi:MAG: hypothetical protein ABI841_08040 [Chloroflexota bacterium]